MALTLFSQKGYKSVTIREIAYGIGIKESSFYNHYASKQAVVDEIYERFETSLAQLSPSQEQVIELLESGTVEDFLNLGVDVFMMHFNQEWMIKTMRFLALEAFFDTRANTFFKTKMIEEALVYQTALFTQLMAEGKIKNGDPLQYANAFHGHTIYLLYRFLILEWQDFDIERVAAMTREHMLFFMQAIA
jgi:AcrR family transcriptional regulator